MTGLLIAENLKQCDKDQSKIQSKEFGEKLQQCYCPYQHKKMAIIQLVMTKSHMQEYQWALFIKYNYTTVWEHQGQKGATNKTGHMDTI